MLITLILVVAAVVLVAHWPALSANALSFDDNQYLTDNHLVRTPSWASARRFLLEVLDPSTVRGYYQPLAMISLMLDYAAGGRADNLRPFHVTSLALHVANTALIAVFLYMLFGEPWIAAVAGLLFGVHPLTVEPVPWVGERKTLLAAFFSLWCLILYVAYARRNNRMLLAGCLVAYVLALLSKPTSTPLPVLMLLLDFWPLRRLSRRAVVEKLPFFIIAVLSSIITYVSQARTATVAMSGMHSPARVPLILCHNIVFYLYKIVWPANLSSHYPFPRPLKLSDPMVLTGVIGTSMLIAALVLSLRRTRALLTGWLFFFVAILPTMGIIGFTNVIASDKYAYLPSVGLLMVLAWALRSFWAAAARSGRLATARAVTFVVAGLLVVAEVAATRRHIAHWDNTKGLYEYMLALAPDSAALHTNLGFTFWESGRLDEAVEHYTAALRTDPQSAEAHNSLAKVFAEQGKFDEAVRHGYEAFRLNPGSPQVHNNLGSALDDIGKTDEAVAHYTRALQLRPDYPDAHNNLAIALVRKGRVDEAIPHYEEALRLNPDFAVARSNLACALADRGQLDDAVRHAREALRINPRSSEAHNNLGKFLADQGRLDEAAAHYRDAARLDPRSPEPRNNLALVLAAQGRLDEALLHCVEAIRLNPEFASARLNLADILARQGKRDDAVAQYQQVLRINPDHPGARERLAALIATGTAPATR